MPFWGSDSLQKRRRNPSSSGQLEPRSWGTVQGELGERCKSPARFGGHSLCLPQGDGNSATGVQKIGKKVQNLISSGQSCALRIKGQPNPSKHQVDRFTREGCFWYRSGHQPPNLLAGAQGRRHVMKRAIPRQHRTPHQGKIE